MPERFCMDRTAKIFLNNRSQAVRLPKDFQFSVSEVFIRKQGDEVVLSPRPSSWDAYLESGPAAPADFMAGVEDLPVQERDF
ncbi:MAG: type II toxin-antitoxin system VapB family antitoxin [Candidatus Desulfobacillus denitrificans]|uniref:Virulence-associated protein VagC n=1 Tax=Candidatus Desulfobacillus denitrificans TaxID=2608985 RepID=A0A809QV88_9PROT|nr:Virulence-associated protein VagC [Candidatus Desulfobacillus denitrificans]HNQ56348.1 type II toxin-antitoxin system VapB family antitoxin [Candidatus Desulfobacillus denitrificans]